VLKCLDVEFATHFAGNANRPWKGDYNALIAVDIIFPNFPQTWFVKDAVLFYRGVRKKSRLFAITAA
jgi:hypothetical protein